MMEKTMFSQYKEIIQNKLEIDNRTLDTLEGEYNCARQLSFIHKHVCFFYGILAIVSNMIYRLFGLNRNLVMRDDDFIFFSCPDVVFRTKNITLISNGLKYSMIFLPNMHLHTAVKYNRFFKKNGINTIFPIILLKDVLKARSKFRTISAFIKDKEHPDYIRFKYTIYIYILYDFVAERLLKEIAGFKGKCILEHQKFYFIPTVVNLRKLGLTTTMMQHGLFYMPVFDYVPLFCDNVLCCSEREKTIYRENGTEEQRITVFGAPLQTLDSESSKSYRGTKYKLLVLMTKICDDNVELTAEILEYVKKNYSNVLVRMRPRSRKEDIKRLSDALIGLTVSSQKNTLTEDINNSEKVVSFSVDANVEVAKQHKPMVYVWTEGSEDNIKDTKFATKNNFKEEIARLVTEDFYSTFSNEQYKMILGETDIDLLKQRFFQYVKS